MRRQHTASTKKITGAPSKTQSDAIPRLRTTPPLSTTVPLFPQASDETFDKPSRKAHGSFETTEINVAPWDRFKTRRLQCALMRNAILQHLRWMEWSIKMSIEINNNGNIPKSQLLSSKSDEVWKAMIQFGIKQRSWGFRCLVQTFSPALLLRGPLHSSATIPCIWG